MGILSRAIRRGANRAVGAAVENAQGFSYQSAAQTETAPYGAFGSFAGAMQDFADEAAKNMKICPSCGQASRTDAALLKPGGHLINKI